MLRPLWRSTAAFVSWLPTLLVLALLAGIALVGSQYHWRIPGAARLWGTSAPSKVESVSESIAVTTAAAEGVSSPAEPSASPVMRITFPSANAVRKAGIQFVPVEVRSMTQQVSAPGAVDFDPSLYARLSSRVSGTIWRIEKEIGDKVRKGEVLALIDSAEVGQAKADFMQALAHLEVRKQTLEGLQAAAKSGAVSERFLREAIAALNEARIRLLNDQQRLLNLGLPLRLADVDKMTVDQLARHLRLLGLPESIRNQLDPETLTASLLPLTAPFDGKIVERNAGPGEYEQTTTPKILFIIADDRRLHFDLDVNPEDMKYIQLGQAVRFAPDGKGLTAAIGRLTHISPEVNEKTRRVQVHAEVEDPDGQLRPHTFGTGYILVREKSGALVVPAEALQSDGKKQLVFVRVSPVCFEVRTVNPGLREGSIIEIDGVRAGEEVVTTGSFALKSELHKDRIAGED